MNNAFTIGIFLTGLLLSATSPAEDDIAALAERGKTLFWEPASCWVCHGEKRRGAHWTQSPLRADALRYRLSISEQSANGTTARVVEAGG